MKPDSPSLLDRLGGPLVVFAVIGMLVGGALVPYAWNAATASDGTVAVIEVHGLITEDTATTAVDDLREARRNESIEAVVLDVNTRGGLASSSEQLYLAVKRTEQQMPVAVSVTGMAASGGYYTSAPADKIFVSPATVVGSIGVKGPVPPQGAPDGQITTGPDKSTSATQAEARRRVETMRRAFVGAVFEERGEKLELSRTELSHAKVYSGTRGVELGLADGVGGLDAAINYAAEQAELSDYQTARMRSPAQSPLSQLGLNASGASGAERLNATDLETGRYYMVYGQLNAPTAADTTEVTSNATN
ncbi:S49 family peptidase [Halorientalis brevis]|uniref:S49 family peptidase n=1 Tax=Halorientalis brevis TaxID=1126241 RepID=A0ABD6C847_9EURY|nr:S49 family peptidase [Halorientalis brevis]